MGEAEDSNKMVLNRVRVIRKELGLNQEEFAGKLNLSPKYISMIETGSKPLSHKLAKRIVQMAEHPTRIDWLMGNSEQRTENELLIRKMEGKEASFRSIWTLLDDALNQDGMTLVFHPDPSLIPDDDFPLFTLPALGDFIIEDLKTKAPIMKIPKGKMQTIQKRLAAQAKVLTDELLTEGGTDDGEQ